MGENSVFHCLAKEGKHWERKTREKFSLPGPQFSSSHIGRKIMGRKVDLWYFYTNTLSHLLSFMTWWPSHLHFSSKKKKQRVRAREKKKKDVYNKELNIWWNKWRVQKIKGTYMTIESESWRKKKEWMRAAKCWNVLERGRKRKKRRGIEIRTICVEEKKKKEKKKHMDEMKWEKREII